MATIAVVIPARNEAENIARLLDVLRDEPVDELVVIDDCSTDDTCAVAERAGVKVHRNQKSMGPGACRNLGVDQTVSEYIAFFDADTKPIPGIIELLLAPLERDPNASATVGVYSDSPVIDNPFQRYRSRLSTIYHQTLQGDRVDIFLTAMGMVRRESFLEAGGFDLKYEGADIEDLEFGDRLSRIGPILLVREAIVGHVYPEFIDNLSTYFWRAGMFARRAVHKGSFDRYQVTRRLAATRILGAGTLVTIPLLILPVIYPLPVILGVLYCAVGWPVMKRLVAGTSIPEGMRRIGYDMALSAASTLGAGLGMISLIYTLLKKIWRGSENSGVSTD